MGLIIDIVLLVITLICVIRHTRLGFVKSVLESVKTIAAAVIAYALRNPVARIVDSSFMNGTCVSWVKESLMTSAAGGDPTINFVTLYEDCAPAYNVFLSFFGLNTDGLDVQLANVSTMGESGIDALAQNIGSAISWFASLAIAILAIFVVALIVITSIIALVNLVTRLPFVRLVNKLLGAAMGLAWATLFALGVGTILATVSGFLPSAIPPETMTESVILGALAELDLLDIIPT